MYVKGEVDREVAHDTREGDIRSDRGQRGGDVHASQGKDRGQSEIRHHR